MAKPTDEAAAACSPRHVLPKDLPNALKHLDDKALDRLLANPDIGPSGQAHRSPRFGTIHICPKDPLTLPLAGWKMRQSLRGRALSVL